MYKINRVNADSVVDFAALELKKYLRMMMPRCGEVPVLFDPDAKDGFRLGLMSDFGIDPDVEDVSLDDVIYIKTDAEGGIIAGSNPRSVLLAVYCYLKENGCLWLFPGPDGESIPNVTALKPVDYVHKASCRYRGQCNEGSETQPLMKDAIDFTPKVGLNSFMLEFDIPKYYYERAYQHKYSMQEEEAPLSNETILRWKRECEAEIARRGLVYHDMGHGWTAESFGFDSSSGWKAEDENKYTQEQLAVLAQVDGVRGFRGGIALNTNFCMSNASYRKLVAEYVADYAQLQNNVDFLHVWLSDGTNNHCECDECVKKVPSDWYVMLLNDIDDSLSARKLDTHIVFIAYVDTLWGPKTETVKNTKRFTMLFAPITRLYSETYLEESDDDTKPYVRNKLDMPRGISENFGYLNDWKKMWKGDCFCYEYHFWLAQYLDLGSMHIAKVIYDDIQGLKKHGLSGIIEDGSQRSYFPTGFPFYVYGQTLFDTDKTFEQLKEEYFSVAFGENWKTVADYLQKLSDTSVFKLCKGELEKVDDKSRYFYPEYRERFEQLPAIVDEFSAQLPDIKTISDRTQYVSYDLIKWHTKYVKLCAKGFAALTSGDEEAAQAVYAKLIQEMAPLEFYRSTCYDHDLCMTTLRRSLSPNKRISFDEIVMA